MGGTRSVVQDAVVLAAGASRRMGRPKALLPVGGIPLVNLHVARLRACGLRVTVVLGAYADDIAAVLPAGVSRCVNPRWEETGPAESAALALAGLGPAVLTPVDVPPARVADLLRLMAAPGPAVLTHGGRDGHPVRLDPPHLADRLDHRLRGALRIPVDDPARILNLNTPDEFFAWLNGPDREDA